MLLYTEETISSMQLRYLQIHTSTSPSNITAVLGTIVQNPCLRTLQPTLPNQVATPLQTTSPMGNVY